MQLALLTLTGNFQVYLKRWLEELIHLARRWRNISSKMYCRHFVVLFFVPVQQCVFLFFNSQDGMTYIGREDANFNPDIGWSGF